MEEYQTYISKRNNVQSPTDQAEEEPKQLSFAEIKQMIENGQAHLIPNNKTIPERLNVSIALFRGPD